MEQFLMMAAEDRVRQMEAYFDELQKSANENPDLIFTDSLLSEYLRKVMQYYEGGHWLQDYELDEKGAFSPNLKRGILSQDAVYDFLDKIKETSKRKGVLQNEK